MWAVSGAAWAAVAAPCIVPAALMSELVSFQITAELIEYISYNSCYSLELYDRSNINLKVY